LNREHQQISAVGGYESAADATQRAARNLDGISGSEEGPWLRAVVGFERAFDGFNLAVFQGYRRPARS